MPLMEPFTLGLGDKQLPINLNLIQHPGSPFSQSFFFFPFDFPTFQCPTWISAGLNTIFPVTFTINSHFSETPHFSEKHPKTSTFFPFFQTTLTIKTYQTKRTILEFHTKKDGFFFNWKVLIPRKITQKILQKWV